jgi:hypothetical protein
MVDERMLRAALYYHDEGLCVIPIKPMEKAPALPTWEEYQARCSTREEVTGWYSNGHNYNLGIVHGEVSQNYVALDIDHDDGMLDSLKTVHGYLFAGRIEQSGSGEGYHIPLRLDTLPDFGMDTRQQRPRGNRTWKTPLGIVNIRARFCQTLVPPSIHPNGNRYRFIQRGQLTHLSNLDDLIAWLDKLAPPPTPKQIEPKPIRPANSNSLVEAVKAVYPDPLSVFIEFGKARDQQAEHNGELRLLGNGGLLISEDRQRWYNFSDEFGGGVFEAWGWCRYGSRYDKHKHFRTILLEMARAAGIDIAKFYNKGDEKRVAAPQLARYWGQQYAGYWEKLRS